MRSGKVGLGGLLLAVLGALGEALGAGCGQGGELGVGGGEDLAAADALGQRVEGDNHLVVANGLGMGHAGLAFAVVAQVEQVAGVAPVGIVGGHHGVEHGLRDLGCRLGGQTLGELDALWVLCRLLQLGLHAIEGSQVGNFPCCGFLADEPHHQEHKAIAGDEIGGVFAGTAHTEVGADLYWHKVALIEISLHHTTQISDGSQHCFVLFSEVCSDLAASGGDDAIVNIKLRLSRYDDSRRSSRNASHDRLLGDEVFNPSPRPPSKGDGPCRVGGPDQGAGTPSRVSPHGPP